jgi:hypothetical protein
VKYEKFLKQIAKKATQHLYWANVHINMAKNSHAEDNLFDLIGHVEHSIFRTQWETNNFEWLKQALEIPRSYVEKSKRTTAIAVLNEWNKEQEK